MKGRRKRRETKGRDKMERKGVRKTGRIRTERKTERHPKKGRSKKIRR